jgi:hypothetical protein
MTGSVLACQAGVMCRNIHPLNNYEPPATQDEVYAAALQFVRKVSGSTRPSAANRAAFDDAVVQIAHITHHLLDTLVTTAPKKDRAVETAKTRARSAQRFPATVDSVPA